MFFGKPHLLGNDFFSENATSVLDDNTRYAIETESLVKVVDHTKTETGKETVSHSINNPSTSTREIREKQEALEEIRSDDSLRRGVEDFLESVKIYEGGAGSFLRGHFFSDPYQDQASLRTIITNLPIWAREIKDPESPYLRGLKKDLLDVRDSPVHKLARGPIFRSLRGKKVYGLRELVEDPKLVSPLPFHPFPIKLTTVVPYAGIPASLLASTWLSEESSSPEMRSAMATFFGTTGGFVGGLVGFTAGKTRDRKNFLGPMSERFANEEEARRAYEAIGKLDELLSFDQFGKDLTRSSIPTVSEGDRHEFSAVNLINAVQSQEIPYVPNDVALNNGQPLTFLTGPNSGGKTSLSKSITQAQVLAQIGCYVPADEARVTVADRIFYQIGRNDSLDDEEGGLGAQMVTTRDVFSASSPRSLVVIDDLIEGTTFEEKTRHTEAQLYGFLHRGATTIYVSHHHELARAFQERGVGNYWQVEFNGTKPTHRIVNGISTNSHSDLVAKRVGFDEEAIRKQLVKDGYLEVGQDLRDISRFTK